jgi:hypothetical protein
LIARGEINAPMLCRRHRRGDDMPRIIAALLQEQCPFTRHRKVGLQFLHSRRQGVPIN